MKTVPTRKRRGSFPFPHTTTFARPGIGGVCTPAQLFIASKTE